MPVSFTFKDKSLEELWFLTWGIGYSYGHRKRNKPLGGWFGKRTVGT